MMQKTKSKLHSKKGFTLVEMIVVLVILAILLALTVPALVKWIDKAKEKQIMLDARAAYLAVQTLVSEDYGRTTRKYLETNSSLKETNTLEADAKTLAGVTGTISAISVSDGEVIAMTYKDTSNTTVSMSGGVWDFG